jgi:hypothetical protein
MVETVEVVANKVRIKASVRRVGVYLDNDSLIGLAKGDHGRRARFIAAIDHGADLMFSPVNAIEVIGPECKSSLDAIRAFLNAIGPHWFPLEGWDVMGIIDREANGASRDDACASTWFMEHFFAGRNIQLYGEQRLDLVPPDFFQLGAILDILGPSREHLRQKVDVFQGELAGTLKRLRKAYESNHRGFDEVVPRQRFDPSRPATFAYWGLLRSLVLEAKAFQFKKGDAADLCHAVGASAFANLATLDKQWKRRIENLPKPNGLAPIYYKPELDQLVADLEARVSN